MSKNKLPERQSISWNWDDTSIHPMTKGIVAVFSEVYRKKSWRDKQHPIRFLLTEGFGEDHGRFIMREGVERPATVQQDMLYVLREFVQPEVVEKRFNGVATLAGGTEAQLTLGKQLSEDVQSDRLFVVAPGLRVLSELAVQHIVIPPRKH